MKCESRVRMRETKICIRGQLQGVRGALTLQVSKKKTSSVCSQSLGRNPWSSPVNSSWFLLLLLLLLLFFSPPLLIKFPLFLKKRSSDPLSAPVTKDSSHNAEEAEKAQSFCGDACPRTHTHTHTQCKQPYVKPPLQTKSCLLMKMDYLCINLFICK